MVIKLDFGILEILRTRFEELDDKMSEYERYINKNGLPYCDYKLNRNKQNDLPAIEKFRLGVKRIMRIVKSYKSTAFTDLLKNIQIQIQEERKDKEKKQLKKVINNKPQTHEEKIEMMLTTLTQKVTELTQTVNTLQDARRNCTCGCKYYTYYI
jgi:hypothetical protein